MVVVRSRIRLSFEDPKILSKSQRLHGLSNSWLHLHSEINTISDLASHVCEVFKLNRSCPNGILLYMEDFILPKFESICLLKDNDIIRVRKKDEHHNHYIQNSGVEEEEHAIYTDDVLAIKESGENSCEQKRNDDKHLCINSKNATYSETCLKSKKKRKQIDDNQESKTKFLKAESKKPTVSRDKDEDQDLNHFVRKDTSSPKNNNKKNNEEMPNSSMKEKRKKKSKPLSPEKESISTHGTKKPIIGRSQDTKKKQAKAKKLFHNNGEQPKDREKSDAIIASPPQDCVNEIINSGSKEDRIVQAYENIEGDTSEPQADDRAPKVQSRSARRKKAKRKWAREMKSQEGQKIQNQISTEVNHREFPELQAAAKNTEAEKKFIPIVIKPGHIRFRSLDEEESEEQQQIQDPAGTFQWNGTTSKKKGQKWGMEKTKVYSNDVNGFEEYTSDTTYYHKVPLSYKEKSNVKENSMKRSDKCKILSYEMSNGHEERSTDDTVHEKTRVDVVDFEKLLALSRAPQVGDVLAYRVIELSSSWCPEVSPFRVGLVTSYDPASLSIVLAGVPEYPITLDEGLEEEDDKVNAVPSLYDADGSLQICYSQLIDVRLLKASDVEAVMSNNPAVVNGNIAQEPTVEKENGVKCSWEELRKELEKKRADLQKKSTTTTTDSSSGLYRAIRKSAVGPILAYLRNKDDV